MYSVLIFGFLFGNLGWNHPAFCTENIKGVLKQHSTTFIFNLFFQLPMQVIVLGDAFVDILAGPLASLPRWGADVDCPSISQLPGGSALNVAVHLGKLCDGNATCSFHGLVGDDDFASILRKRIAAAGVIDCMETTANGVGTGVCLVLSGKGERAFVTQVELLRLSVNNSFLRPHAYQHLVGGCDRKPCCRQPRPRPRDSDRGLRNSRRHRQPPADPPARVRLLFHRRLAA